MSILIKNHGFDQETELAAFLTDWQYVTFDIKESWPWRPLQHILQAYLEMIKEEKVTTYSDPKSESPGHLPRCFPWEIYQHTQRGVEKAVVAFTGLLDMIESRLPSTASGNPERNSGIELPYSSTVIDESFARRDSFARDFLSALSPRRINFHYIAPGIRIQSPTEFIAQPFAALRDNFRRMTRDAENPKSIPCLLFRGDGENKSPWNRPWFPDGKTQDIPAGLYFNPVNRFNPVDSGNESRLLLPFEVGHNGHARSSNGVLLSRCDDMSDKLYQVYQFSDILPWDSHSSQIHKVLLNWAERVEKGDWGVNEDGVADGIGKFKDADTPENWKKYATSW